MDKNTLFGILNYSERTDVIDLGRRLEKKYGAVPIKKPHKTLVMLKIRESARNSLFYAGEALACECMVKLGDNKGFAASLGDDLEKVYAMAVIDAALNSNLPETGLITESLKKWEGKIKKRRALDSGLAMSTKVNFSVMEE
ncbi:MAG: phosphonate C-P lyase system protein PhnG [Oscillospiraceae bacterium]|nr:phosphonate C-P lyase system protein PhnG [Oscillospiraceae bacterium]